MPPCFTGFEDRVCDCDMHWLVIEELNRAPAAVFGELFQLPSRA
tara:strand:+ start:6633 stop:6764 length:132 start_codon:yes stop_codon:yes gene_type:complete